MRTSLWQKAVLSQTKICCSLIIPTQSLETVSEVQEEEHRNSYLPINSVQHAGALAWQPLHGGTQEREVLPCRGSCQNRGRDQRDDGLAQWAAAAQGGRHGAGRGKPSITTRISSALRRQQVSPLTGSRSRKNGSVMSTCGNIPDSPWEDGMGLLKKLKARGNSDAENSASLHQYQPESQRQSFGWSRKEWLYCFVRQRRTLWAAALKNPVSWPGKIWWGVLQRGFKGSRVGLLIRIRVCAGPAFSDLLLHSSGSFNLAPGGLFHLLGVLVL